MNLKLRQLFVCLLFLGLFLMTLRPITDPDFWWHLRTGQYIVQTGSVPSSDPFSFTKPGHSWIAHEWLIEVIFYGLFQIGDYGLLILFFSLIITGAFIIAFYRSSPASRPYAAGFVTLLGAISTAPTWGVRPQMISLFFTSIFLLLLDLFVKSGKKRWLVPLPLLILIWVNTHAGYLLGLAIVGIYILGRLLELVPRFFHRGNKNLFEPDKLIIPLSITFLVCLLATIANPNGVQILIYPFQTLTSPSMQQFIQEWFSADYHLLEWQPFVLFVLGLIGAGMFGKFRGTPTQVILAGVLGFAAFRSMRNIPLFVIATIPILSDQVASLISPKLGVHSTNLSQRIITNLVLVVMVIAVGFRFYQTVQDQSGAELSAFPGGAVDWIETHTPSGQMLNTYGWGGYLIWRLYPEYHVYVDGRADVYGDEFLYEYTRLYEGLPGWEQALESQNIHLALLEPDSGLARELFHSAKWELAFQDSISVVFLKDDGR